MRNHLLKKTVLTFAALLAFAVTSVAQTAQLLSFGFYQADNAGLSQDYVATIPALVTGTTSYEVEIGLPASVDLTELVARFTVNEGNTVTVDGVAQTSGVTKNDFTDPVDYMVRGSNNVRYTITVVEAASGESGWKELAVLDATQLSGNADFTGVYSGAVLAIGPKDNAPYVAYGARGVDNKMSVAKYENGAWTQVGQTLFSSVVNGSHYDFDIAPDGTPYVAYGDQDAASLKGALSVMKFDGTQWSYVGDQGFFKVQAQYPGLAAVKGGLAIDLINNSKDGDIARRAMGVATYADGAWTAGESSLLGSGQGVYMTKMGGNGNIATLISVNRGAVDGVNYGHNIFKYENGQWESLATNFLETGATQTSIAPGSFGTTVALDGTIYAWTGDDAPNTDKVYQVRLKKYNAETKTWSVVAGNTLPIGHDGGFESHLSLDVAIAPDGTPYVAYNNFKDQKKLYVMYLDPSTNQWSAAQQLAEDADDVNIKFDKAGNGYITYTDGNNKVHLLMLEGEGSQTSGQTLIDYPASKEGTSISGTTVEGTVKIHLNADAVACYTLKNGYSADGVCNDNYIKLETDGGFKAGDVLTVAGCVNNSDESKWGTCVFFTMDADKNVTAVKTFENFINSRLVADDPVAQSYTLEADADVILLGRSGNTGTNLTLISVVRPGGSEEAKPAIAFEAGAAERTITIGLNAAGKVSVDWGNGNKEEKEAAGAYDGWDNGLEFTGTPAGTVKVYGEGISYFQSFTKYAADATTISDGITSVDLSGVAETITELDLHQNNLKSVDLSKLAKLTTLNIGVNDFATINLSANTELTSLDLSNGKNNGIINALDLSKNTKLTKVVLSGNQLTTLDLSNNPLSKTITVLNNQLTSIIFGANTATKHTINVGGNKLTSLDLMQFADCSGTYLRARDNDLTEVKLPAKVSQFWADGNAFTLAQLYDLKSMAKTLTYATTFTKAEAQAPLTIAVDGDKVDLSAQAKLGETATTFTWKAADGTALVEGTDYTVADGVFTFLKSQTAIHCEMTNDELNAFTAEKPYKTTAIDVVATGIATIPAASAAGTDAPVYNLAGQRVSAPRKGVFIKAGKTVIFK